MLLMWGFLTGSMTSFCLCASDCMGCFQKETRDFTALPFQKLSAVLRQEAAERTPYTHVSKALVLMRNFLAYIFSLWNGFSRFGRFYIYLSLSWEMINLWIIDILLFRKVCIFSGCCYSYYLQGEKIWKLFNNDWYVWINKNIFVDTFIW